MEEFNNTGCPIIGCPSNVPQETELLAKNRKWSHKQRQRGVGGGGDGSGKVVIVITATTGCSSSGKRVRQTRRLQIQLDQ